MVVVVFLFFLFHLPPSSCQCPVLFNGSVFISPVASKIAVDKCVYEVTAISHCELNLRHIEANIGEHLQCWVREEGGPYVAGCQCEEWRCESYEDEVKEHLEMFGRIWRKQTTKQPCLFKKSSTDGRRPSATHRSGGHRTTAMKQYVNYNNLVVLLVVFAILLAGIILAALGARMIRNSARRRRSEHELSSGQQTTKRGGTTIEEG